MTLRVLHAHSGNIYGGVETILVTLARHAALAPDIAWRFALTTEGRLSGELAALGAAPIVVGSARASRPWTVWAARAQLAQSLRRAPCDVAIVHSLWGLAMFGATLRRSGARLVRWVHGPPGPAWQVAWAARTTPDLLIANSRYTASHWLRPHAAVRHEVVYPPLAQRAPAEGARARIRAELGVAPEAVALIHVARVEPAKGQRLLIEALSRLGGPWVLWVAGRASPADRAYEAALRADVARLGLERRVTFLGERTDIPDLLEAADIFVQPNVAPEPFGLALVEALAAGLPVVATDCGAVPELTNPATARVVPPGAAGPLRDALSGLMNDAPARQAMRAAGPAAARAINDPARIIPRLAALLREVPG